uniref:NAC domain-containing protein n=1 Tax=Oryza meridionalis TaxID=40149 RepID=A0A0E0EAJ2_9ORYZ
MAPLADPAVEGFRIPFLPSDSDLLDCLLIPKIASGRVDSRFAPLVHDVADMFALPPGQLAATHAPAPGAGGAEAWYFFGAHRRARAGSKKAAARAVGYGGGGCKRWCSVGAKKVVEGGGFCQRFRYKERTASGVLAPPRWVMVEYGVAEEPGGEGVAELVLCKIFRSPEPSPHSESGSPSSSSSASASPSCSGGRKRKAAE